MSRIKMSYITDLQEKEKKYMDIIAGPHEFILTTLGCWVNIVADETTHMQKGEIKPIKIKTLELKPEQIMLPCPLMRNAIGCVLSLGGEGPPKRVEKHRKMTYAIFTAYKAGTIQKDELLGVMNTFSTAVSISALARMLLNMRHIITHLTRISAKNASK
ncbi:MAG: DUF22 domain-containing protein [Candidatus Bathyarchaeota archaeon]